ncbi:MAG TPA: ABC transporter ATP-binding protein [Nitrospiraceae bacterium]|nr:ABC transporter ATP-binding protein [Nitrospiraceae bacterium]
MPLAVEVDRLCKRYRVQRSRPVTLRESLFRRLAGRGRAAEYVSALHDVTFSIEQGQILGVVGHNGAGKSTLLRLLCGLGRPTSGRVVSHGMVNGLLELGTGFHPDLTGRQNIMTTGVLNGLRRSEVAARQDAIVTFAELEPFIDQPVRTYSSGMYLRLAFAAAMEFDPSILIIDEVLTVGDERFQQKCLERIQTFRAKGKTLVVTSHDAGLIQSLCDQVLVLEEGRVVVQGDPKNALACYHDLMRERTNRRASLVASNSVLPHLLNAQGSRQGTQEAAITSVRLLSQGRDVTDPLTIGQDLTIELTIELGIPFTDLACTVGIFSETHVKCFEAVIASMKSAFGTVHSPSVLRCKVKSLPLLAGTYFVNVGLFPTDWSFVYDFQWQMHPFRLVSESVPMVNAGGVVALQTEWAIASVPVATAFPSR